MSLFEEMILVLLPNYSAVKFMELSKFGLIYSFFFSLPTEHFSLWIKELLPKKS